MRLRAVHFACFLLLLSTFGVAESSSLGDGGRSIGGQYVEMLLQHGVATDGQESAFTSGSTDALRTSLPVECVAQTRAVWAMRAPSAQSAAVHTLTGFGR